MSDSVFKVVQNHGNWFYISTEAEITRPVKNSAMDVFKYRYSSERPYVLANGTTILSIDQFYNKRKKKT